MDPRHVRDGQRPHLLDPALDEMLKAVQNPDDVPPRIPRLDRRCGDDRVHPRGRAAAAQDSQLHTLYRSSHEKAKTSGPALRAEPGPAAIPRAAMRDGRERRQDRNGLRAAGYGRLDCQFNNAGMAIGGDARDLIPGQSRTILDLNLHRVGYRTPAGAGEPPAGPDQADGRG